MLQPELLVLAAQPHQLVAFRPREAGTPRLVSAIFLNGFGNPGPDRLTSRFKLTRKLVGIAPGMHQIDHLATEFRRIRWSGLRHQLHLW